MIDWAATIVAVGTPLTAAGGAGKFIWDKVQTRFEKIEADLESCRTRENSSITREAKHIAVIELLWNEVASLAPNSRALKRGKHIMDSLKATAKKKGGTVQ